MVNRTISNPERVFHRLLVEANKSMSFKELLAEARSALQLARRGTENALEPETNPKALEINPDPASRCDGQPVPVSAELVEPEIDPLELALAPVPVTGAASHTAGLMGLAAEQKGTAGGSLAFETALIENVVKRVSFGGDRRRGVARLELDGDYAGTTLWVRGEGSALELEVRLGVGLESSDLPERLLDRLRARGLEVSAVDVR